MVSGKEQAKARTLDSSVTYDNNGNRTSGTKNGLSFTASYDAQDRLTGWNSNTYGHNANGERTTKTVGATTTTYTYDVYGHQKSAVATGLNISYVLDPIGRRVARKSGSTVTSRYLYNGQYQVAAELNSNNTWRRVFLYASRSNVPDYFREGSNNYALVTDHLGSVRLVVQVSGTGAGTVVLRRDYDEFGSVTNTSGSNTQPFGFAGGIYDSSTGLVHFGEREYDPETGRWVSKDPIGFDGGDTNLFGYVLADPINFIDPTGLYWFRQD